MLGAAVLLVALAGCAPAVQPQSTTGPSAAATAAPAVAATAAPLAGDDCTNLLAPASLAAILHESKKVTVYTGDLALAAIGGFGCGYADDAFGHAGSYPPTSLVSVIVAPSAIVDPSELAASLAPRLCGPDAYADSLSGEGSYCAATDTVAGWWYSLSVTTVSANSGNEHESAFASIKKDLERSLEGVKVPEQLTAAQPLDCAAASAPHARLAAGSRLIDDDLLGPFDPEPGGDPDADPFEPPTDQEVLAAAYLLAGPTSCNAASPGDGWRLEVFPGGASAYAQCVEGLGKVTATTNPKVVSAFTDIDYAVGGSEVCATDGKSVVAATNLAHNEGDPWDAKTLESLGALLAPVFANSASLRAPWTAALPAASASTAQPPLGGNCAKLLDSTAAAASLGEPNIHNPAIAGDPTLATVGGLDCELTFGNPNSEVGEDVTLVTVVVAPSAIADPAEVTASLAAPVCDSDVSFPTCTATATVDGWWYSLEVDLNGVNPAIMGKTAPIANFKAIAANLEQTLKSTAAPGRVAATKPFDCASVGTAGTPVIRSRALPGSRFWAGYWNGADTDIRAAAFLLAGPSTCKFPSDDDVPWYLTVYPGGASAYRQCTHVEAYGTSKALSIPGVQSATLIPSIAFGAHVCATDGTNTVLAVSYLDGKFKRTNLSTLTALLVPVFAAIK